MIFLILKCVQTPIALICGIGWFSTTHVMRAIHVEFRFIANLNRVDHIGAFGISAGMARAKMTLWSFCDRSAFWKSTSAVHFVL